MKRHIILLAISTALMVSTVHAERPSGDNLTQAIQFNEFEKGAIKVKKRGKFLYHSVRVRAKDPQWSDSAKQHLKDEMLAMGIDLVKVRCVDLLCHVKIKDLSYEDYESKQWDFRKKVVQPLFENYNIRKKDGKVKGIYLRRYASSFPWLAEG